MENHIKGMAGTTKVSANNLNQMRKISLLMEKCNSIEIIDSEKSPEHSEYSKGGVSSTLDLLKNEIRKKVKKKNISRDSSLTEK